MLVALAIKRALVLVDSCRATQPDQVGFHLPMADFIFVEDFILAREDLIF